MTINRFWTIGDNSQFVTDPPPDGGGGKGSQGGGKGSQGGGKGGGNGGGGTNWPGGGGWGKGGKKDNGGGSLVQYAFSANGATSPGTANSTITDWAGEYDPGSAFNATNGIWTVPRTGLYWIGGMEYSQNTLGNSLSMGKGATVPFEGMWERMRPGATSAGDSHQMGSVIQATLGETYYLFGDEAQRENAVFGAVPLAATEAFAAYKIGATGSANTIIPSWTEVFDLGGNFDPTTGVYTVPSDGLYLVTAHGYPSAHINNPNVSRLLVYRVGVGSLAGVAWNGGVSGGFRNSNGVSTLLQLTAGWEVGVYQDTATFEYCRFSIAKIDPSVYFGGSKVAASGSVGGTITGFTENYDVGSGFDHTNGTFTAPSDGVYWFAWRGQCGSTSAATSIVLTGGPFSASARAIDTNGYQSYLRGSAVMNLSASDVVSLTQNGTTMSLVNFEGFKVD